MTDDADVISLADRRAPTVYTVTIVHHWDGTLEFRVEGVQDDPRSRESVMWALRSIVEQEDASG